MVSLIHILPFSHLFSFPTACLWFPTCVCPPPGRLTSVTLKLQMHLSKLSSFTSCTLLLQESLADPPHQLSHKLRLLFRPSVLIRLSTYHLLASLLHLSSAVSILASGEDTDLIILLFKNLKLVNGPHSSIPTKRFSVFSSFWPFQRCTPLNSRPLGFPCLTWEAGVWPLTISASCRSNTFPEHGWQCFPARPLKKDPFLFWLETPIGVGETSDNFKFFEFFCQLI